MRYGSDRKACVSKVLTGSYDLEGGERAEKKRFAFCSFEFRKEAMLNIIMAVIVSLLSSMKQLLTT
jgi:hypothetical protein